MQTFHFVTLAVIGAVFFSHVNKNFITNVVLVKHFLLDPQPVLETLGAILENSHTMQTHFSTQLYLGEI